MAEVFGTVASALAVAELLAKSVSKVKKLWDEVQNVPDEVAWLIEQLDHYKLAVEAVEAAFRHQDGVFPNITAESTMRACSVAVDNLEALAVDLQNQILAAKKTRRNITKLKVSLKKDTIQRHQCRLNFIFNMLSMSVNAQSLFQSTQLVCQNTKIITMLQSRPSVSVLQYTESVLQGVAEDTHEETGDAGNEESKDHEIPQATGSGRRRRKAKAIPWKAASFFGGFAYSASSHPEQPDGRVYQARFQLPWWMSRVTWDFQAYRLCSKMGASITAWTTQPDDDPIFDLLRAGTYSDIASHVKDNRECLRFRNTFGLTLMDIALESGRLDVIKGLISMGLNFEDPNCVHFELLPLPYFMFGEDSLNLFRFLISSGGFDEYMPSIFEPRPSRDILSFHLCGVRGLIELLIAENFQNASEYIKLPISTRFKILWHFVNPGILLHHIKTFGNVGPLAFRSAVMKGFHSRTNLHAFCEAYMLGSDPHRHGEVLLWNGLARWILTDVPMSELTSQDSPSWRMEVMTTVLINGLIEYVSRSGGFSRKMTLNHLPRTLHNWLGIIQDSGVNLQEYGKHEMDIFNANNELQSYRWGTLEWDFEHECPYDSRSGPRLERIVFGPKPEDWEFVWDRATEEFVEEFWDMVENPPLQVPGAWVEDVVEW